MRYLIIGNDALISQLRFAFALSGLTLADFGNELESIAYPYPESIDFKIHAARLMEFGKQCHDIADYFHEPPPAIPRKIGQPTTAKGKSQYLSRKILPCNRK